MKNIEKKYAVLGRFFEDDEKLYIFDYRDTHRECLDYIYDKIGADLFLDNKIWIVRADIAQKIVDNSDTLTDEEVSLLPLSLIACL